MNLPDALARRLAVAGKALLFVVLGVILYLGWREFYFLTDDAFITFRYIDHHRRGWGYTWNPPPFQVVEGYSNFLWMILLEGVWIVTGATPPRAANVVSLILSGASLAIAFAGAYRAPLPPAWQPRRLWLAVSVVIYALASRTFLTWTSSGLETSLFGLCVVAWVWSALELSRDPARRWLWVASASAAASALTRPDGMLLALGTAALPAHLFFFAFAARPRAVASLLGMAPLLAVPIHLLWRRAYYGAWVPNTYHAKLVSAWPEAGVRYAASFILEQGLIFWALLGLVALAFVIRRARREGLPPGLVRRSLPVAVAVGVLLAHAAYYTLVIGGDHFEYRVFAHLVIPLGWALARFAVLLPARPAVGFAVFFLVTAIALPVPWVHHARSRRRVTRKETIHMVVPIADAFPAGPARAYGAAFDELQAWMAERYVGTRAQEHKVFWQDQLARFPSRAEGKKVGWDQRLVAVLQSVGISGWVMPEVAILDRHGLNDRVVARTKVEKPPARRLMAHERTPPPGYIECFDPNVVISGRRVLLAPGKAPITDERIRECEARFAVTSDDPGK